MDCALDIFGGYIYRAVIFFDAFLEEDRVEKAASHTTENLVIKT